VQRKRGSSGKVACDPLDKTSGGRKHTEDRAPRKIHTEERKVRPLSRQRALVKTTHQRRSSLRGGNLKKKRSIASSGRKTLKERTRIKQTSSRPRDREKSEKDEKGIVSNCAPGRRWSQHKFDEETRRLAPTGGRASKKGQFLGQMDKEKKGKEQCRPRLQEESVAKVQGTQLLR